MTEGLRRRNQGTIDTGQFRQAFLRAAEEAGIVTFGVVPLDAAAEWTIRSRN
jgi:glycine/D-amino acid oxidase-like deaminating enzyme